MRVYPDQLVRQLSPLPQCCLIFGDDPWLCEQSRAALHAEAKRQGFEEKIQLSQETGFSWNELYEQWQAMSLFSSRRIIELTLPQAKPGTDGSAMLQSLMQMDNPDVLLILSGPKLASEQTKSKWFKSLDAKGIYVPCATPEGAQFQRWLDGRINHYGLTVGRDAREMLFALYEGNLLAADQALQLLQLLSPNDAISCQQLEQYFEDQSRFSVFQLTDAMLNNQQDKAQHILSQLKSEGVAMPIILWSLFKELGVLMQLKSAQNNRQPIQGLWSKLRIWDKRKPIYQTALNRLELEHIESLLAASSAIELKLKQQGIEDWTGLSHVSLLFDPKAHRKLSHIELT
ncbi:MULTISPECIES: DNA polymerase III subunit delta [Shewanella]|uniref:DNA polymerase III subunit delta n=1 Tax=Shewanella fidelis TaxID=173509 RepID=A0AAW8NHK4_9GAMM|nr:MULTISPECIES: DNA polymerase III subunit delta [Shewanella]MDR8522809.1 DNA polymerase III subunit delta [Shewanella fidelis]MDW4814146.1 DNA polymerase III subunit delta [Shewanella fidelis]MDW4818145.1 DNA polymerase III subunit delta [Shewanella fidelis]MDW4822212.1 DNA polymerase III subunit delta [Shewanella fidelis]MDW4826573.1 DNA polymerase III subunit delta [Shewanella fidelis]